MKRIGKIFAGILGSGAILAGIVGFLHGQSDNIFKHESAKTPSIGYAPSKSVSFNASSDLINIPDKIYYQNKVVIVTFHDISSDVYSQYVITPPQFSADLDAIKSRFNVITNQQFINFLNGHGTVPPNAVLLTFDDGYRDMYTYALPILLQHHLQGTFFEIVGSADKNDPTKLTWTQIKTMVGDGMVFESHTYDSHYEVRGRNGRKIPVFDTRMMLHSKLETLNQYDERVYGDFLMAREELSRETGEPIVQFAWPYGWGTSEATYLAERAGYRDIYTTVDGYVSERTNPLFIPRIDIGKSRITPVDGLRLIIHFSNVNAGFSGWISNHLPGIHHIRPTNKFQQLVNKSQLPVVHHQGIFKVAGNSNLQPTGTKNIPKQSIVSKQSDVSQKGGMSSFKQPNVSPALSGTSKKSTVTSNKTSVKG